MRADRSRHVLLAVGAAVAGVAGAHALNYLLAFPDPAVRARELAATGHGYWPLAVGLAVAGCAAAAGISVRNGLAAQTSTRVRVTRVAALQIVLFLALECVERLGAGVDPLAFLHSAQLLLGVALQIAVAFVAVFLLRSIEAGTRSIAAALRRPPRRRTGAGRWVHSADRVVSVWRRGAAPARGPPALALT